jgi:hypothetical protein
MPRTHLQIKSGSDRGVIARSARVTGYGARRSVFSRVLDYLLVWEALWPNRREVGIERRGAEARASSHRKFFWLMLRA